MQNQNLPNPESLEAMRQIQPQTPEEIAALNLQAQESLQGHANNFDSLVNQLDPNNTGAQTDTLTQKTLEDDQVEASMTQDFAVTAGPDRYLTDEDGQKLSTDRDTSAVLATELLEADDRKTQINKVADRIGSQVVATLAETGIDSNDLGGTQQIEAQVKTDMAEEKVVQQRAGGAVELSPEQEKKIQDAALEETARQEAKYFDEHADKIGQLAEEDPDKAATVIDLVAARRSRGGFSKRMARDTGRRLANQDRAA